MKSHHVLKQALRDLSPDEDLEEFDPSSLTCSKLSTGTGDLLISKQYRVISVAPWSEASSAGNPCSSRAQCSPLG